jgi:hypothetical protein
VVVWSYPPLFIAAAVRFFVRHPSAGQPYFTVLGALIAAWSFNYVYWRLSWRLELDGATLRWRGTLRRGELPVAELERVSLAFLGNITRQAVRLSTVSGPSILVAYGRGYASFTAALVHAVPGLHVERR